MSKDKKPVAKTPAAKPVTASAPAVATVKPAAPAVVAKVEAVRVEPVKVAPAKIETAIVETVKAEPVIVAKAKSLTAAVAKAEPAVMAPPKIETPKVEAVKAAPSRIEVPKAQPAKKAAKPEFDVMQPFAVIQEQFRAQAEKGVEQVRANYASMKGNAETATAKLEESMLAARSGAKLIGEKVLDAVRVQAQVGFDHAQKLGAVKTLEEAVKLQQAFMIAQFDLFKARATEFASVSGKIANDISEPAKASLTAAFRR